MKLKVSLLFTTLLALPLISSAQSTIFNFEDAIESPTPARPAPAPAPVPPPPGPAQRPSPATPAPTQGPNASTEAGVVTNCPTCRVNKNIADLQALVNGRLRMGDLTSWRKNRGLVQIPTEGPQHFEGPCGSTHYNPMSPGPDREGFPTDNYASPLAACVMMSLLQDWKKVCPDPRGGCRVFWGDISHRTQRTRNKIWVHQTHTDGECIDIRPMRKGRAKNQPLSHGQSDYDREATRKFIQMARDKGADTVIFGDTAIPASRGGHHDHIHICFRDKKNGRSNDQAKNTCRNFRYDAAVCEGG